MPHNSWAKVLCHPLRDRSVLLRDEWPTGFWIAARFI
jgi:hypothetical protein